jgi:hypothetical protein
MVLFILDAMRGAHEHIRSSFFVHLVRVSLKGRRRLVDDWNDAINEINNFCG